MLLELIAVFVIAGLSAVPVGLLLEKWFYDPDGPP